MKLENISLEMDFREILLKIERASILRSIDTEATNFQVRLQFMVAFRNWYLIAKIGTLLLFSSAFI